MRTYLIHYSEIGLKKGNRDHFEERLIRNIYQATRGLHIAKVRRLYGRFLLEQEDHGSREELERCLARVYGIAHFDPAAVYGWDLDRVRETLTEWAKEKDFESFAVRTRRVNKQFPKSSKELNTELGALIQTHSGARVDLKNPERAFEVIIVNKDIHLVHKRIPGPGGLPVGVSGRLMLLLSGGIDSPVAAERMMRRGASLHFVHFHSAPFTDRSSQDKAVELAEILCAQRKAGDLFMVPLGAIQQRIVAEAPSAYRVMLYRRYMLRIADRLAFRKKCKGLVTGECLSQVASQTLENLGVLDRTVSLPILRPLLGFDKQEIIHEAQAAGTYDLSVEPGSDCCSYLLPPKPVIKARLREVEAIEAELDLDDLLAETFEKTESVRVGT